MEQYFFYPLAFIVLIASIRVVMGRNAIHSALWLVLVFFCFGGLYLLLHAEFVAAIQVIVYAGAIMVLFLFVIMLLRVDTPEEGFSRPPNPENNRGASHDCHDVGNRYYGLSKCVARSARFPERGSRGDPGRRQYSGHCRANLYRLSFAL